jgi:hypothetical protein
MSLHNLASNVQSQGRGSDTMLVHMSPREVGGLQALAKAHGGSLSINPSTGLPEAGFLEDILPVVAAGALTAMTAGAAAPAVGLALGTSTATGGLIAGAGIGALLGGGMAAMQGGNFGRGALMGGLSGALGGYGGAGGFEGLFGSTAPAIDTTTGAVIEGSSMLTPTGVTPPAPDVSNVYSGMAGQPTVAPGTMPPIASGAPPVPSVTPSVVPSAETFAPSLPSLAQQQAQMAQAGTLQSGLDLGGVGASPAAMAPGSTVPTATAGTAAKAGLFGTGITGTQAAVGLTGLTLANAMMADQKRFGVPEQEDYTSPLKRISPNFRAQEPIRPNPYYRAQYPVYAASGGVVALQAGGPVERMSMANTAMNPQGGLYPQGMIDKTQYATPIQRPVSSEMVSDVPAYERSNPMLMARGGISTLGDYSDGGRLLKGPGDGVSDNIPATIGERQPARLADGEFVVPARIVSELGNGSTDAGARKLYGMMDRIQKARRKSMGKGKHAVNSKPEQYLPA